MPIEERLVHPDGTVEIKTIRTAKDYFQYFMYFLRGLTCLMLALNIAAFCIVIKIGITASNLDGLEKAFIFLSMVGFILVCIGLMIAEYQAVWFVKRCLFLHFWGGRGLAQVWIGIQVQTQIRMMGTAIAIETGGDSKALVTFCEVVAWMIISAGLVMILLSAFCVRGLVKLESDKEIEAHVAAFDAGGGTVVIQKNITQLDSQIIQREVVSPTAVDKKELEQEQTLAKNLSTALGISYIVAKSRFGGGSGAGAAEKHRKEEIALLTSPTKTTKTSNGELKQSASIAGVDI